MNPLRVLGDLLAGREPPPYVHPLDDALSDHERLMRHTGRPECPIPEHRDALRRLGRVTMERDEWQQRALRAEEKLRHPSSGQAA